MDNYCCQNYITTWGAHYCKFLDRLTTYFGIKPRYAIHSFQVQGVAK